MDKHPEGCFSFAYLERRNGMKDSKYWHDRFIQLEQSQNSKGAQCYAHIEMQYRQAQREIEGQIARWYQRFSENNDVSLAEAKKMLNAKELEELKWDVNEYIRHGEENAVSQQWMKQLENASARYHISRLEALKLQVQQSIETMYGKQLSEINKAMRGIYESGYYHTAFEIHKGIGVGWNFATLDEKTISKVINKPWAADGKNFSERVWENRQRLVNELNTELTRNIMLGQDPQKAIDAIAKKLNVSKSNAGRLVMTEEAFFSGAAQKDCFRELDVEQYEIVATLDSQTSEICREMDGKVFPMTQWEIGTTAPPFHVRCRTTTVPSFGDEFDEVGKRAARGKDGKTYYVDANMTYKEWHKAFVEGDKSGLQGVEPDEAGQDAITDFATSRKQYDEQVQKLAELEKQSDETLDVYMDAMDTPQAATFEQAFNEKYDEVESFKQMVKDMKAVLSGKEANAVRQVEKKLAVKTGIPIDKVEMTGLQYDTASMIYDSYNTVLKKFPELKGQLAALKYDGVQGDKYAGCITITGEVKVHGIFAKFDDLVKSYADDVAIGFHPVGTDYRSVIVHELGHALDGYMTKQRLLDADFNGHGIIRTTSQTAKDMTLKFLGFDRQKIAIELKNQGLTLFQRRDILEQRERNFIIQHVSEYAADNEREFFAECFAEYMTSDNPRDAAKIFGKIIEKALGR